jgi:hypothetical protein
MDVPSLEPRRARWNHTRRFEGITKSNLQGNSAPKAENLQIRLFDRPQLAEPFNALGVLHGRLIKEPEKTRLNAEAERFGAYRTDGFYARSY